MEVWKYPEVADARELEEAPDKELLTKAQHSRFSFAITMHKQSHSIYILGGVVNQRVSAEVKRFDLTKNELLPFGEMQSARRDHSATIAGDMLYVIGGSWQSNMETIEVLDLLRGNGSQWRTLLAEDFVQNEFTPRMIPSVVAIAPNKILIMGGLNYPTYYSDILQLERIIETDKFKLTKQKDLMTQEKGVSFKFMSPGTNNQTIFEGTDSVLALVQRDDFNLNLIRYNTVHKTLQILAEDLFED